MTKKNTSAVTTAEAAETLLKWRLKGAPTLDDVTTMLDKGIISKEEARQILFSELEKDGQVKALEEQVEFLKDLIDRLSKQPPQVVWKYVETYTPRNPWPTYTSYASPIKLGGAVGYLASNTGASGGSFGGSVTLTSTSHGTGMVIS